jgi:hypothetical protein
VSGVDQPRTLVDDLRPVAREHIAALAARDAGGLFVPASQVDALRGYLGVSEGVSPAVPVVPASDAGPVARLTVDVTAVCASQVKALAVEAAQVRGWRRANVGDLLAALVEQLVTDPALQRKVIVMMAPPARRSARSAPLVKEG